jgi:serine/threonine protein kinase
MVFEIPRPCLLTPFMRNGSLQDRLASDGRMDNEEAHLMGLGIALGLEYLHQKRIIHGDMKSPNVLVRLRSGASLSFFLF